MSERDEWARRYPASDWKVETVECVVCPGCAFTFDACHVTEATGQYDCPICGSVSFDGARREARDE